MPDQTSDLKPLKAVVLGPPASGKTKLSERLCQHYGAHYVNVKSMIDETLQELNNNIEKSKERKLMQAQVKKPKQTEMEGEDKEDVKEEEMEEEEFNVDLNASDVEDYQEQIKLITNVLEKSPDRKLPEHMVLQMMKTFLLNSVCQTRGYILDGYPKSTEQAKELFGYVVAEKIAVAEEGGKIDDAVQGEGEAPGELPPDETSLIRPDFLVCLEATDDFLCQRVMRLPQKLVYGTHFDELGMLRRLAEYRENNQEDDSVIKLFDDNNLNPIVISLIDESSFEELTLDDIYGIVCDIFGDPIPGFGLTPEEEDAIRKLEIEQQRLLEEEGRLQKQLLEKMATKEYEEKMEKWSETLEKLQLEEEKVLAAQSEPLRFYLMKYIFPTLSKGLVEVAKVKPEDPVDFLAEYLFKENPEGKMFDPSYTSEGERILQQYEEEVEPVVGNLDEVE